MKTITLTQPWATLIALGAKRIETRSWTTAYRGPLAIHAAAGLGPVGGERGLFALCHEPEFHAALSALHVTRNDGDPWSVVSMAHIVSALPRGCIVAVCKLVDCVSTDLMRGGWRYRSLDAQFMPIHTWQLTDQERAFGDLSPGRFAWLLANIRPLRTPIPARGALGLWEWYAPADLEERYA